MENRPRYISANLSVNHTLDSGAGSAQSNTPRRAVSPHAVSDGVAGWQNENSNWTDSIPVTRKRTSIRRIFTWLTPDFQRLRGRNHLEDGEDEQPVLFSAENSDEPQPSDEDPPVSHHFEVDTNGETLLSDDRRTTSEDRRKSYKYDIRLLEQIIPKMSVDVVNGLNDKEGEEASVKAPKANNVVVEEATSKAFSFPAFKLRAFKTGTTEWTDAVMLYTNAMRCHSRALYAILFCLKELGDEVTEGHLRSFFVWFEDYHDYFCNFIALINNTFLPALRVIIPFRHHTPEYFGREGERLNRTISKTLETSPKLFAMYEDDTPRAIYKLTKIYNAKFAQQLCLYLYTTEKYGATICERFCSSRIAVKLSKHMAGALKDLPNFHRSLPMVLRWLEHRPLTTCKWLTAHYDYFTVRIYRWWRRPTEHERTLDFFRLISPTDLGI